MNAIANVNDNSIDEKSICIIIIHSTYTDIQGVSKSMYPFPFCNNFGKCTPILTNFCCYNNNYTMNKHNILSA